MAERKWQQTIIFIAVIAAVSSAVTLLFERYLREKQPMEVSVHLQQVEREAQIDVSESLEEPAARPSTSGLDAGSPENKHSFTKSGSPPALNPPDRPPKELEDWLNRAFEEGRKSSAEVTKRYPAGTYYVDGLTPMPAAMLALMIKKVLMFDRTLHGDGATVVIWASASEKAAAEHLRSKLSDVGQRAKLADGPPMSEADKAVFFLFRGAYSETLDKVAAEENVLTITDESLLLNNAKASVFIGQKDGKPEIRIHTKRLETEGHDLTQDLLRLATLVH
jgi:hypothetical protein